MNERGSGSLTKIILVLIMTIMMVTLLIFFVAFAGGVFSQGQQSQLAVDENTFDSTAELRIIQNRNVEETRVVAPEHAMVSEGEFIDTGDKITIRNLDSGDEVIIEGLVDGQWVESYTYTH